MKALNAREYLEPMSSEDEDQWDEGRAASRPPPKNIVKKVIFFYLEHDLIKIINFLFSAKKSSQCDSEIRSKESALSENLRGFAY